MSQENVELVRGGFEAWNAGDMNVLRDLFHPDAVLRMPEGWPEPGPYVGREAIMRQFDQMRETWDADAWSQRRLHRRRRPGCREVLLARRGPRS
jgi:ketosteroid isomerase-like protein